MKKLTRFLVPFILIFILTSCANGPFSIEYVLEGEPFEHKDNEFSKKNNFLLPKPEAKEGYVFDMWYDNDSFEGKGYLTTRTLPKKDITLYGRWILDDKVLDLRLKPYETIGLDRSLSLPRTHKGLRITYESSHPEILSITGELKRDYEPATVILTAKFTDEETGNYSIKEYTINTLGYKDLTTGSIASSYILRNYDGFDESHLDLLDIVNASFVTVTAQGNLNYTSNYLDSMRRIIPLAKERGVRVMACVGPGTYWTEFTSSSEAVDKFVSNMIELINRYGFDGVDIDWETPKAGEEVHYVNLMKKLHAAIKANNPNHLLTTAIIAGPYQHVRFNFNDSLQYTDYINLMSYSLINNGGNYHNALYDRTGAHDSTFQVGKTPKDYSTDATIPYLKQYNIPNEKVIIGVAFYGYIQKNDDHKWVYNTSIAYHNILNLIRSNEYFERYDEVAQVPYLLKKDYSEFISYENPRSIRAKAQYAKDNGFAGLMYWEHFHDDTMALIKALNDALKSND